MMSSKVRNGMLNTIYALVSESRIEKDRVSGM
jgi:hypothetical protein